MAHLLLAVGVTVSPPSEKILASHQNQSFIPPATTAAAAAASSRRDVLLGVFGVVGGSMIMDSRNVAEAAARRPPPPPPKEKNDPNVSGVLAKVLASKKRKEAMKQTVAQLRDKGKPIINQ